MMSAQGILIEVVESDGARPSTNETSTDGGTGANAHEQLYLVTMNGQRQVMNEDQIRQLVTDIHQNQMYQTYQQPHYQYQHYQPPSQDNSHPTS